MTDTYTTHGQQAIKHKVIKLKRQKSANAHDSSAATPNSATRPSVPSVKVTNYQS